MLFPTLFQWVSQNSMFFEKQSSISAEVAFKKFIRAAICLQNLDALSVGSPSWQFYGSPTSQKDPRAQQSIVYGRSNKVYEEIHNPISGVSSIQFGHGRCATEADAYDNKSIK